MVTRPTYMGGLGFDLKWNMGWMHDMLSYMEKDPIHRRYHQNQITFSLIYAFSENFILPFSHDEVVHLKRSMLDKMPGDLWRKFANLRALYAYMYSHPGKKLLFMGGEFGQWTEWNEAKSLDWHLLEQRDHQQLHAFVRDLNQLYLSEPALHRGGRQLGGLPVDRPFRRRPVGHQLCAPRSGSEPADRGGVQLHAHPAVPATVWVCRWTAATQSFSTVTPPSTAAAVPAAAAKSRRRRFRGSTADSLHRWTCPRWVYCSYDHTPANRETVRSSGEMSTDNALHIRGGEIPERFALGDSVLPAASRTPGFRHSEVLIQEGRIRAVEPSIDARNGPCPGCARVSCAAGLHRRARARSDGP